MSVFHQAPECSELQDGPGHEEVGASRLKEAPEAARDRGWWRMTKGTIGRRGRGDLGESGEGI